MGTFCQSSVGGLEEGEKPRENSFAIDVHVLNLRRLSCFRAETRSHFCDKVSSLSSEACQWTHAVHNALTNER
jgi:hypothetical protein